MNPHTPPISRSIKSWLSAGLLASSCAASFAATVSYTPQFAVGWNLVGNSANAALDVKAAFGTQAGVQSVWKWDAAGSKWAFYAPALDTAATLNSYAAAKGYSVLTSINAGEGYWVNTQPCPMRYEPERRPVFPSRNEPEAVI